MLEWYHQEGFVFAHQAGTGKITKLIISPGQTDSIEKVYCVLSATELDVFRGAAIEWCPVQGSVGQVERLLKMSSNNNNILNTVFMTTISYLTERFSNHNISNTSTIPTDPNDVTSYYARAGLLFQNKHAKNEFSGKPEGLQQIQGHC